MCESAIRTTFAPVCLKPGTTLSGLEPNLHKLKPRRLSVFFSARACCGLIISGRAPDFLMLNAGSKTLLCSLFIALLHVLEDHIIHAHVAQTWWPFWSIYVRSQWILLLHPNLMKPSRTSWKVELHFDIQMTKTISTLHIHQWCHQAHVHKLNPSLALPPTDRPPSVFSQEVCGQWECWCTSSWDSPQKGFRGKFTLRHSAK